jgi:hypothetical protein
LYAIYSSKYVKEGQQSTHTHTHTHTHTQSEAETPGLVLVVIHAPFEIPDFKGTQELHLQGVVPQVNKQLSL